MGKENSLRQLLSERARERALAENPPVPEGAFITSEEQAGYSDTLMRRVHDFAQYWGLGNLVDELLEIYDVKHKADVEILSGTRRLGKTKRDKYRKHERVTRVLYQELLDTPLSQMSLVVSGDLHRTTFNNEGEQLVIGFGAYEGSDQARPKSIQTFSRELLLAQPEAFYDAVKLAIVEAHESEVDYISHSYGISGVY